MSGRTLPVTAFLALLLASPRIAAAQEEVTAAQEEIELDFLNGVYTDLDRDIQPVERGAMTLYISSPKHRLAVHRNLLRLSANGDGTLDATVEVEFEGEGHLVVEIETGRLRRKIEDDVTAPRQTVSVSGKARLERVDGGYLMTVADGPPSVDIVIRSDLAGSLVALCRTFARLPLIPVNCDGIETALSVVTAPLPKPGEQFLVPAENLTEDERAYFDRFVPTPKADPTGALDA